MPDTGFLRAQAVEQFEPDTHAWTDLANLLTASDLDYAECDITLAGTGPENTQWLELCDFGFALDDCCTIVGVEFEVGHQSGGTGEVYIQHLGLCLDRENLSDNEGDEFRVETIYTEDTWGGATDLCGAKLTPEIVNDPAFGIRLQYQVQEGAGGPTATGEVDLYFADLKIYYEHGHDQLIFADPNVVQGGGSAHCGELCCDKVATLDAVAEGGGAAHGGAVCPCATGALLGAVVAGGGAAYAGAVCGCDTTITLGAAGEGGGSAQCGVCVVATEYSSKNWNTGGGAAACGEIEITQWTEETGETGIWETE